jgi:translation initiation factor 3 subunit H
MLSPLPITISSPSLLSALLSTLSTPSPTLSTPTLKSPQTPLPTTFQPLLNPLTTSLPSYLTSTLDALTLQNHEANNVAFLVRQIGREKQKHDATIKEREEENVRRRKQGLSDLPGVGELRGGTKDPSRLELLCLQGSLDGLGKGMGEEAGKGLVRCYL